MTREWTRRTALTSFAASGALLATQSHAAASDTFAAQLAIRADLAAGTISPDIFGQFAEFLGHGVYGGLWVGRDSAILNTRGFRNDVIAALREIEVPVLRWPGGCYADRYHWRDGVGGDRPVRLNQTWGGVEEPNAVGTHEYMDLIEQLGAKAYINANVGTGSPQEAADWLEYMTSNSHSTLAEMRRRNGRDAPWEVAYFALGNELWQCGGDMRPAQYADQYRQFARFLASPDPHKPQRLAAGAYDGNIAWTEGLMANIHDNIDAVTLHHFALPTGSWTGAKGPATGFGEEHWFSVMRRALAMDGFLSAHSAVMDRYDPAKRIGLYVDEWSNWYDPEPGTNPAFLDQQNTLRDALTAAINLNIFQMHHQRVRMACITQMVNVLQAMVHTDGPRLFTTPTYHVYRLYKPFRGATHLPVVLQAPRYAVGAQSVPALHAAAARKPDGSMALSLVNLDPHRAASVSVQLTGAAMRTVSGDIITAGAMDAHNSYEAPNAVTPQSFTGASIESGALHIEAPAKSLIVLSLSS